MGHTPSRGRAALCAPWSFPASLLVLSAFGVGCNTNKGSNLNFAFDRPEFVETVCINRVDSTPLPLNCCSPNVDQVPLAAPGSPFVLPALDLPDGAENPARIACGEGTTQPALHALVTQSVRGEVAAVDLPAGRVLDSDQQIPGYTFVDVGGQPTTVVVPPEQPSPGYEPTTANEILGPRWVYVASASDQAVRAVATCRFRLGVPCGPERPNNEPIAADKVELFLRSMPRDMFYGPDEALWVSLPEAGSLARVKLAPEGVAPNPDPSVPLDPNAPIDPFLTDANGVNVLPDYFRVPAPSPEELALPVNDAPYLAVCGLGHNYTSGTTELPLAPRVAGEGIPSPTVMRYDPLSGFLFVADQNLPVLHVFSLSTDGVLTTRGSVAVGEPMKDFVLTPTLPAEVSQQALFTHDPLYSESTDSKRFLYGLDPRGGLMAFELRTSASGASLLPLKAPVPERYQDRFQMLSRSAVGVALEVVDTRPDDPNNCGNGIDVVTQENADGELTAVTAVPKSFSPDGSRSIVTQMQSEAAEGNKAFDRANKTNNAALIAQATAVRNQAQGYFEIARDAGPTQLRGVFLFVVSMAGEVNVFDLLDLDVQCRAQTSCVPPPPPETPPADAPVDETPVTQQDETSPLLVGAAVQTGTSPLSLGVQRNAPRLTFSQEPVASVSNVAAFTSPPECGAEYVPADRDTAQPVCLIADPWVERDQSWNAQVDAPITGLTFSGAILQKNENTRELPSDQLAIYAPAGISLCGRGAQATLDDVVAILGATATTNDDTCPVPTTGNEIRLKILDAFDDHLVVRALGLTTPDGDAMPNAVANTEAEAELTDLDDQNTDIGNETTRRQNREAEVNHLLRCYTEYVTIQVRSGSSLVRELCVDEGNCPAYLPPMLTDNNVSISKPYLVSGTVAGYLHRTIADANGRCVDDPARDPRYQSHAKVGELFENPQLSFTLTSEAGTAVSVVVSQGSSVQRVNIASTDLPSARPTSLRWFPFAQSLFLVDSATQGLRRLELAPFRSSLKVYR
ncbi:MAG: hypothetical protein QM778_07985 [Myxococcales bacterium]